MVNILSLQSWVAAGHVGNAAALFPLQRLGAEVTAIHTVQFSNHPGHGTFTGRMFPAADIADLVAGLDVHGALAACDGVLSGYVGDPAVGAAILDAARRVRAANRDALWCCDPVMGDNGALYVRATLPEFFINAAVPQADILTPNRFELELLTGAPAPTLAAACKAAAALRARMRAAGPRLVLVTSLDVAETPPDSLDMLLAAACGTFRLRTERLPSLFSGAGDLLAALFLFHVLTGKPAAEAAGCAAASVAGVLWHTWQAGGGELRIVAAQQEFLAPTRTVLVQAC